MAFLDNPDLCCLVIFLEKLQPDLQKHLIKAEKQGYLDVSLA